MNVTIRIPLSDGNQAVTAVATPSIISEISPKTCSLMKMMIAMTPTARKPGISRIVCSQPISTPVNPARSMTKLFRSADHVANARGIAAAIRNNSVVGLRQNG